MSTAGLPKGNPAVDIKSVRYGLGFAFFLEDDQGAVFADGRTGEGFAQAGDRGAALLGDAVFKALHHGFNVVAGNGHVDLAAFGLAGIVTAAARKVQVGLLVVEGKHVARANGRVHAHGRVEVVDALACHPVADDVVGLHGIAHKVHNIGLHSCGGKGADRYGQQFFLNMRLGFKHLARMVGVGTVLEVAFDLGFVQVLPAEHKAGIGAAKVFALYKHCNTFHACATSL